MQSSEIECPACKSKAHCDYGILYGSFFYTCPVCGRFEITADQTDILSNIHLGSYLYYHRFVHNSNKTEYRYHTTLSKDKCDAYDNAFTSGDTTNGHPVHIDNDLINAWYPKSFSERIDNILLRINSISKHIGQVIEIDKQELLSLMFVDRKEHNDTNGDPVWRDSDKCFSEAEYVLSYLFDCEYVKKDQFYNRADRFIKLILSPKGYARIDELQKNTSSSRNVLVAMKFGDETHELRKAIREGIQNAGYHAIFMDEVEHNEFITPELLKQIRDSKFVVVDLTHKNNGAYFEEGYAMGLGKQVIQLCKRNNEMHFDVAQKNTIMWETEKDIPHMLTNRIKATID